MPRTRRQEIRGPMGKQYTYYGQSNQILSEFDSHLQIDTITDNVLPGNYHDLIVEHRSQPMLPHWDVAESTNNGVNLKDESIPLYRLRSLDYEMGHLTDPLLITTNAAAVELLKRTNPSREYINLPVFALELKKLPQLILKRTRDLGEDLARGRLSMEYGWKPFVRDLIKFYNFQTEFEKRVLELKKLNRSGLRRKRELYRNIVTGTEVDSLSTTRGFNITATYNRSTTVIRYGSVVWKFAPETLPFGNRLDSAIDPRMGAAIAMLSLNILTEPSVLYEAIPFSWLLDWCTNVGDYLHATRNFIGVRPEKLAIMTYRKTEQKVALSGSGSRWPKRTLTQGSESFVRTRETKERARVTPTLEAHYPFLSERQVMILGDIVRSQFGPKVRAR